MLEKKIILLMLLGVVVIGFCFCKVRIDPVNTRKYIPTQQLLPENSIGVVYLDSSDQTNHFLTIRFPNHTIHTYLLPTDTSNYIKSVDFDTSPTDIILFDERGELTTIKKVSKCTTKFWCENDGGVDYDPTFVLQIAKSDLKNKLTFKNKEILGEIVAFAVINFNPYHFSSIYTGVEDSNVVMRGRLSTDYSHYYIPEKIDDLYKYYDRNAQISYHLDEAGDARYCLIFETYNYRNEYELACCGP